MSAPHTRDYRRKRDFERTPEPRGGDARHSRDRPSFVVHKHDASTTHYDFRLEANGVLKSWAVPKGPSTDPREKRLALRTEDHPLEYAGFEGVIPEDEYGGGTVMIWDAGAYENAKEGNDAPSIEEQIDRGHVTVRLHGRKIRGGYALTRTDDEEDRWLLVKMDDREADARRNPTSTENRSVASGRTMREIAHEERATSSEGGDGS